MLASMTGISINKHRRLLQVSNITRFCKICAELQKAAGKEAEVEKAFLHAAVEKP